MYQPYLSPLASHEIDPLFDEIEAEVASGSLLSITDDKADMGGKLGHTQVPEYMTGTYRASVLATRRVFIRKF